MKLKPRLVGCAITLVIVPAVAWFLVKPLRVIFPTLMPGVECPRANVCTDDVTRLDEAQKLYEEGYTKTVEVVGAFQGAPRMVFCTTQACSDAFGLGQRAAEAVGNLGLVIAPRGWKKFYIAHELIHYRQAESLGNLAVATKPKWLIEGMAYSLSDDPRHPLGAPFEQWRSQFEAWHAHIDQNELWRAASEVH